MILETVRRASGAWRLYQSAGLGAVVAKVRDRFFPAHYEEWVTRFDTLTEEDARAAKSACARWATRPLISILMPTWNSDPQLLRTAIESVRAQWYSEWELCIADDCSDREDTRALLEEYARNDPRIKVIFRKARGHISLASNTALAEAKGEFLGFLDHDDVLRPHALWWVVWMLQRNPSALLLYSDEDKLTPTGRLSSPHFKSDWNPSLFLQQNYFCHFTVVSHAAVRAVGGFREGVEGAQDWDLFLRIVERVDAARICHIPTVLYHWRMLSGSTAQSSGEKPYVSEAQCRVVREHLVRRGVDASVSTLENIPYLKVSYAVPKPAPIVSIIIPTRDRAALLRVCVEGVLKRTEYQSLELIVVDNGSEESATQQLFAELRKDSRVQIIHDQGPFNFSRLNNLALQHANGSVCAFLNNDLEVCDETWLTRLVALLSQPGVGAVGARLLYPNNTVQHAGVIVGIGGVAGHPHKRFQAGAPGYFGRSLLRQDVTAVTAACMLARREIIEEVGGFDEESLPVAFNDVDLCLKIRRAGHRIVYEPEAVLIHHESASRGYEDTPEKRARFEAEKKIMQDRWGETLRHDPFYNPNLSLEREDFSLAYPPRVQRPWLSS